MRDERRAGGQRSRPGVPRSAPARAARLVAVLFASALAGFFAACAAPTEHSIEPYRSSPLLAFVLSARASTQCLLSGQNGRIQPLRPFATDGCSAFPDAEWSQACCVEHDIAYWCGGDASARRAADAELGRCVAERKNAFMGWLMEAGVRFGGHPIFPTSYRWGYGHAYRPFYPSAVADD